MKRRAYHVAHRRRSGDPESAGRGFAPPGLEKSAGKTPSASPRFAGQVGLFLLGHLVVCFDDLLMHERVGSGQNRAGPSQVWHRIAVPTRDRNTRSVKTARTAVRRENGSSSKMKNRIAGKAMAGVSSSVSDHKFDEARLVDGCRRGDSESLHALMKLHSGRVMGLIRNIVGDEQAADSLTQEAFFKAFRSMLKFQGRNQSESLAVHHSQEYCAGPPAA